MDEDGEINLRFTSFEFISKGTLFTFPFSRMDRDVAMCDDGDTIYSYFFSVQVFNSLTEKL